MISSNLIESGMKKRKEKEDKKENKLNREVNACMCVCPRVHRIWALRVERYTILYRYGYLFTAPSAFLWNLINSISLLNHNDQKTISCAYFLKSRYYLHRVNHTNLKCIAHRL